MLRFSRTPAVWGSGHSAGGGRESVRGNWPGRRRNRAIVCEGTRPEPHAETEPRDGEVSPKAPILEEHHDTQGVLSLERNRIRHDLSILRSPTEFSDAGFGCHTDRGAMPEVLEPPVRSVRDFSNPGGRQTGQHSKNVAIEVSVEPTVMNQHQGACSASPEKEKTTGRTYRQDKGAGRSGGKGATIPDSPPRRTQWRAENSVPSLVGGGYGKRSLQSAPCLRSGV